MITELEPVLLHLVVLILGALIGKVIGMLIVSYWKRRNERNAYSRSFRRQLLEAEMEAYEQHQKAMKDEQ